MKKNMSDFDLFDNTIYLNSPDNKYRYALGTKGEKTLYCFGINPSTATPEKYDPTVTRVSRTAKKLGFDSFIMLNIYPLRATDPDDLPTEYDISYHCANIEAILKVVKNESVIWAAWGDLIHKRPYLLKCRDNIMNNLQYYQRRPRWVKMGELTKSGNPRHPLYLKYQPFSEFKVRKIESSEYYQNVLNC